MGPINKENGLRDTTLRFGQMTMIQGRAFWVNGRKAGSDLGGTPTYKKWLRLGGHTFLIENVPYNSIHSQLKTLPTQSRAMIPPPGLLIDKVATLHQILRRCSLKMAKGNTNPKPMHQFAQADFQQEAGVVLDYSTINSSLTNYDFKGDTTYYISGPTYLYGTNTFEGGTVMKYATNACVVLESGSRYSWLGAPYHPVVMTAVDDNAVGEAISGSTGNPTNYYYANPALLLSSGATGTAISNFRISYAEQAVSAPFAGDNPTFSNGQIIRCQNGIYTTYGTVLLRNMLFGLDQTVFDNLTSVTIDAQNSTFFNGLLANANSADLISTNCIFVYMGNYFNLALSGGYNGFCGSPAFGVSQFNDNYYPFQTKGGGSYYLTNGCPFLNVGTTNIDPHLLADIATKTTYPPIVYSNDTFTTAEMFPPQAHRDTDTPDLGYHYDPLDYVFGGCIADSNITFTASTTAGWFDLPGSGGPGYGIALMDHVVVDFQGTVSAPCVWTFHDTVQEGGNGLWTDRGWLAGLTCRYPGNSWNVTDAPQINAVFTHFSILYSDPNPFRDYWTPLVAHVTDCDFSSTGAGTYNNCYYFTNCFFNRASAGQSQGYNSQDEFVMRNCTFYGGSVNLTPNYNPIYISVRDCAFDGTTINVSSYGSNPSYVDYDYNAFTNGAPRFPIGGTHDKVVTSFNWQSSWFGNYYLPTNSLLIDAGDVPANQVGLYYFTVQTNQVPEGTNTVDIGYHYVATDANGYPLETFGDGTPNYLDDQDGDGLPDSWELAYFGRLGVGANTEDGNGYTMIYDYEYRQDPTAVSFNARLGNRYFNSTNATGAFITKGIPESEAVLINNDNFNNAIWTNYDGIIHLELGLTDGVYQVWYGLKPYSTNYPPQWEGSRVILDRVPPTVSITSLTNTALTTPVVQVQGWSPEELNSVRYDLSNAVALITNQDGSLTGRFFDTNVSSFTSNYFQCFDVPLTNGLNVITLHAIDLAGNETVTNLKLTLDYSLATNPIVQLTWPQDGMEICQSDFTLRGWTDDSSSTVVAQMVDTNGVTNIEFGSVDRTGVFRAGNLPLSDGTNWLTLTVTNEAGLSSETNITLVKSDMTLTLTNINGDLWLPTVSVSGFVSDPTAAVWVNGVEGTNYGDGTWSATNVPVTKGCVASFDMNAIPAGGGDPHATSSTEKQNETVLETSHWTEDYQNNLDAGVGGGWEVDHETENYSYGQGGTWAEHSEEQDSNRVTFASWDLTYKFGPDGSVVSGHYTDSDGYSQNYTNDFPSGLISHYDGACSYKAPGNAAEKWSDTAHTLYKYLAGGDEKGQSIYPLTGTAVSYPDGEGIPYDQISVAGKQLGTHGNAYKGGSSGESFELPLSQPAPMAKIQASAGENRLIHLTEHLALTNTNRDRTTIGVGEDVDLYFSPPLNMTYPETPHWFSWDGTLSSSTGSSTEFTAPDYEAASLVGVTVRDVMLYVPFSVVEPKGIDHADVEGLQVYNIGTAGAGMALKVYMAPTSVSFYKVQCMEVGEDASENTGYFAYGVAPAYWTAAKLHHFADSWFSLSDDNSWEDLAGASALGLPSPWLDGQFSWNIPAEWKVGNGLVNDMAHGWDQNFQIDSSPTVKVTKFGHTVTRSIDQNTGTAN